MVPSLKSYSSCSGWKAVMYDISLRLRRTLTPLRPTRSRSSISVTQVELSCQGEQSGEHPEQCSTSASNRLSCVLRMSFLHPSRSLPSWVTATFHVHVSGKHILSKGRRHQNIHYSVSCGDIIKLEWFLLPLDLVVLPIGPREECYLEKSFHF